MGTAGAPTPIKILQNTDTLLIKGNFAEHAKHVYSEWNLTDCQYSCSWIKPWSKPQGHFDTQSITSHLVNPSNATCDVEELCYLCFCLKSQELMWGGFLRDSHMEQQDTHLPAKEELPSKGGDGSGDCFCPSISTPIKGFFSWAFRNSVHCVLHQQHTFHSEVLERLACVIIYTCISFLIVFGTCRWQKYSLLLQPPPRVFSPGFYFSFTSFKFTPDSNLKSGFSVLNQTYGMLL